MRLFISWKYKTMKYSESFILGFRYLLPNPFTIAILLTLITFMLALTLTSATAEASKISQLGQIFQYWEMGFWDLLSFTMQMMLILVLGHALALTPLMSRFTHWIALRCQTTPSAALLVSLTTIVLGLLNWGLALIVGAILARKIGETAREQNRALNYPLIGAAGYLGLLVWHGGLSGSATLKVAESNHFLAEQIGQIPVTDTIFSTMNLTINLVLLVAIPCLFYLLGKMSFSTTTPLPTASQSNTIKSKPNDCLGAEHLDYSSWFGKIFGLIILSQAFYLLFFKSNGAGFTSLSLNLINFILLGLGLFLNRSIHDYLNALEEAIIGSVGILIQFPLYAGIAGVIKYSGLIAVFSQFITEVATPATYPLFTFLSAALVNIFVPSGGGQWAVQGPIIAQAAQNLNASMPLGVMAFAYGDQITNMLQPFWALPLLSITKLKAHEIIPYSFITMIVAGMIFGLGLFLFT